MEHDVILWEFVRFRIYPEINRSGETEKVLNETRDKLLSLWAPDLERYIWHEGGMNLSVVLTEKPAHLEGEIVTGDSVEDEWFLTHLLLKATLVIPCLAATVCDADGEFLLIEAAEHLPSWLEPETSENRVFLYRGKVHIVGNDAVKEATLESCLEFVRRRAHLTEASSAIQTDIKQRLCLHEKGPQLLHHARIVLPIQIARMLARRPQSITPLVASLTDFTPSELQKASLLQHCRDSSGGLDLKSVKVTFTQLQFAKLLCMSLNAPKAYIMPSESSPAFMPHLLGAKLALGLELAIIKQSQGPTLKRPKEATYDILDLVAASSNGGPLEEFFGPDDDLSWMDAEEGPILNSLASKLDCLKLDQKQEDDLVQQMLDEEENPKVNSRLLEFMNATSGLDGIAYDPEKDDETSLPDSDRDGHSDSDDYLEAEIIETIMHDPDLLMKIIEKSKDLGLDSTDFIEKLRLYNPEAYPTKEDKSKRQKGLADIDPAKIADAGKKSNLDRSSPPASVGSQETADGEQCLEDVYPKDLFKPNSTEQVADVPISLDENSSDLETEQVKMTDLMALMDEDLRGKALDRDCTDSLADLSRSSRADSSPSHPFLLTLVNKK